MNDRAQLAYTRAAGVITAACYAAGHAAVGAPLMLFAWIWRLFTHRRPLWCSSRLDLPLAVFAVILILSAAASAYRSTTGLSVVLTIAPGAVFFGSFAWLMHRDAGARLTLLRAWAIGGPPAAIVGIVAGRLMHDRPSFPGMPMGSNGFGTTLLVASLCALGLAYRARGRERAVWMGCSLVSLIGLLATISRSAWAGWIVGAVYLTWRAYRDRPKQLAAALALGAVILGVAGTLSPRLVDRVRNPWGDFARDRLLIWQVSLRMIAAHPLLGSGPGTFKTVFDQTKAPGDTEESRMHQGHGFLSLLPRGPQEGTMGSKWSAHNLWLHFAAETGLLGLASILWVVIVATREGLRPVQLGAAEATQPIVMGMWFGLLANQFGDNTLVSVSTIAGFLLLMAMLVIPSPVTAGRGRVSDAITPALDGVRPASPAKRPVPVGLAARERSPRPDR